MRIKLLGFYFFRIRIFLITILYLNTLIFDENLVDIVLPSVLWSDKFLTIKKSIVWSL